jgi:hypothetical protein
MLDRLAKLFSGYENVYGQYSTDKAQPNPTTGKVDGSAWTERGQPAWKKHVEGKVGLGIIPLKIENTVSFGAIDIDIYKGISHSGIENKVKSLGLPLIVCKSKSGGAHLYVFFKEPVAARIVIDKLSEWATILGYGGVEIFPKQSQRVSPDDVGNWINMPYFGGDLTQRYAFKDGKSLKLAEFIDYAESKQITAKELRSLDFTKLESADEELLEGAPPCLCIMYANGGVPEGMRNDTLFNAGVYAQKKYGDDLWREKLHELNTLLCKPEVSKQEMAQLIKSLQRKESYEMRCNGPHCNKKKCRMSQYGRGPMYTDLGIDVGGITKVEGDEAAWYVEINDKRVKMATADLMSQSRFNTRCVEMINMLTIPLPYNRWLEFIQNVILAKADVVQLPREATWDGQFWHRFTQFTNAMGLRASSIEEVILGKVWTLAEGDIVFMPIALFDFLNEVKFRYDSPEQVWAALLDREVKRDVVPVNNREIDVWRIKKPEELKPEVKVTLGPEVF